MREEDMTRTFDFNNHDAAETTINRLGALQGLGEVINRHLNLQSLLDSVIEIVFSELNADNGSILLVDDSKDFLDMRAFRGLSPDAKGKRIRIGEGIAGKVALSAKPVLLQGTSEDSIDLGGVRPASSLCVPILFHDQVRGVICANRLDHKKPFSYKDMQMLQVMASQTATAIDNVTLMDGLRANNYAIVRSLAEAVEVKDPYTAGHCDFVARYSTIIAKAMGLPDKEVEEIKIGAILHDVGKIGISEEILSKVTKLSAEEFEIMKQHPINGAKIVDPLKLPRNCLYVIKYHHERPDGKGYPYNLSDEEIYTGAKIVAVADTFDAMTSNRPYRNGLPIEQVIKELKRCSGTQFDPIVIDTFMAILPDMIAKGQLRPHLCPTARSETNVSNASSDDHNVRLDG